MTEKQKDLLTHYWADDLSESDERDLAHELETDEDFRTSLKGLEWALFEMNLKTELEAYKERRLRQIKMLRYALMCIGLIGLGVFGWYKLHQPVPVPPVAVAEQQVNNDTAVKETLPKIDSNKSSTIAQVHKKTDKSTKSEPPKNYNLEKKAFVFINGSLEIMTNYQVENSRLNQLQNQGKLVIKQKNVEKHTIILYYLKNKNNNEPKISPHDIANSLYSVMFRGNCNLVKFDKGVWYDLGKCREKIN
jgi:hypothetical protein